MKRTIVAGSLAVMAAGLLVGCSREPDPDAELQKKADAANAAAVRSGGDWNKLSKDEQQQMLSLTHGNQRAAQQLNYGLSGKNHEGEWGTPEHPLGGRPGATPKGATAGAPK